ncbi:MAG: amidase, partial [Gemmatimonadetes bacterium]|nr:amidase [Gemmatimonadota bacterium]
MNHSPIARVAAEVRSGATTARSLAEDAIRSYEASDLGAYIAFDAEGARRRADAVDAAVARGEDPGPLAGVTVSVKDLYGVEGLPIRAGTRRELPDRWQREGFLVRSLRRLGAVVVGKTHTVELAFGGIGLNPNTGTPINPWDPAEHRAPGGSSSGAGVSLWEGSAMLALGSDTGGSVRIPASATGVVGMRHTTGRWPTDGVVPLSTTFDTVGFLTHTVEDTRHVFQAIDPLAPGVGSPDTAPDPDPDPDRAALAGHRIGLPRGG